MTETTDSDQRIYEAADRMIAAARAGDADAISSIARTPDPKVGTRREWRIHLILALATVVGDHLRDRVPAGVTAAQVEKVLLLPSDGWQARAEFAQAGQEITPGQADEITPVLARARQVTALAIATCLPVPPEPVAGSALIKTLLELVDHDPDAITAVTSMLVRIAVDVVPAP